MKSDLQTMSRQELRAYILANREDEAAFQLYLDIAKAEPGKFYLAPRFMT